MSMRIDCPLCGPRDSREFSYLGSAKLADRPDGGADEAAFFDHVHIRDNRAGENRELWHHGLGCRGWLVVTRDTISHEISAVALAQGARG